MCPVPISFSGDYFLGESLAKVMGTNLVVLFYEICEELL